MRKTNNTKTALSFSGESLTEQCHAEELKPSNILKKYARTGILPESTHTARFLDVASIPDLHTAMNLSRTVQEDFQTLSAHIRKHFDHDPEQYYHFAMDPENRDALAELGLPTAHLPEPIPEPISEPTPTPPPVPE